jgi:hypothetical protein
MGEYGTSPANVVEVRPPEMATLDNGHTALLTPYDSHSIDVSYLVPPLEIVDDPADLQMSQQARVMRDSYIDYSEASFAAVWHEAETFLATVASDNQVSLSEDALFNTHIALDELLQNAYRHGGSPQRLWTSLVMAHEIDPGDAVHPPLRVTPGQPLGPPMMTSNRVLLGVQDHNPHWNEPPLVREGSLSEHFRGLDLVRGLSRAVWHRQVEGAPRKWVWVLI